MSICARAGGGDGRVIYLLLRELSGRPVVAAAAAVAAAVAGPYRGAACWLRW